MPAATSNATNTNPATTDTLAGTQAWRSSTVATARSTVATITAPKASMMTSSNCQAISANSSVKATSKTLRGKVHGSARALAGECGFIEVRGASAGVHLVQVVGQPVGRRLAHQT